MCATRRPTAAASAAIETDDSAPTRWTLIGRLKNRADEVSWREFFDTYWKLIYSVALKAGLTPEEAEEVVQETVISVSKKIDTFRADPAYGSFKSWLLQLTRWRVTDQFRKRPVEASQPRVPRGSRRRGGERGSTATEEDLGDPAANVLDSIWDEEWEQHLLQAALEKVKRQVSPRHFQIFYLHVIKQVPALKAARALGVNLGRVYLVKHRVRPLFEKAVKQVESDLRNPR
jgi:RNA polymerase sigma factor (sigma-70 family)